MNEIQPLSEGSVIGNYKILRLLGSGGMGHVYLAHEMVTEREVALKVLSPELSGDTESITRFKTEAKALSMISHPNIVSIYNVDEIDGIHFLVMEYVDGKPLKFVVDHHALPANEAIPLFIQMLNATSHLHSRKIVHRDIKPGNIIYNKENCIKLVDFGIAKIFSEVSSHRTATGIVMGTPTYMAPEVTKGLLATPRADVWSLGTIFYEMLTGQPLINAKNFYETVSEIQKMKFSFPEEAHAWIPDDVQKVVAKMCERDPGKRYASCEQVKADLVMCAEAYPSKGYHAYNFICQEIPNEERLKHALVKNGFKPIAIKRILNEAMIKEVLQGLTEQSGQDDKTVSLSAGPGTISISKKNLVDVAHQYQSGRLDIRSFSQRSRSKVRRYGKVASIALVILGLTFGWRQTREKVGGFSGLMSSMISHIDPNAASRRTASEGAISVNLTVNPGLEFPSPYLVSPLPEGLKSIDEVFHRNFNKGQDFWPDLRVTPGALLALPVTLDYPRKFIHIRIANRPGNREQAMGEPIVTMTTSPGDTSDAGTILRAYPNDGINFELLVKGAPGIDLTAAEIANYTQAFQGEFAERTRSVVEFGKTYYLNFTPLVSTLPAVFVLQFKPSE